jgi:hypothetical protein
MAHLLYPTLDKITGRKCFLRAYDQSNVPEAKKSATQIWPTGIRGVNHIGSLLI